MHCKKYLRQDHLIAGLLAAVCGIAAAAQTGIPTWDELTLRGMVHGAPITVVVRASGGRLTGLSADTMGTRADVPASELTDVSKPQLNGVQIVYGIFPAPPGAAGREGERPYHSIKLRFGEPKIIDGTPQYSEALFVFWGGNYRERWVRRVEGKDEWRYEIKRPGEPPEPANAESAFGSGRDPPR